MFAGEFDLLGATDFRGTLAGAGALAATAFGATLAVDGAAVSVIEPVDDFEATDAVDLAPVETTGLVDLPVVRFLVLAVAVVAFATLGAVLVAVEVTEETELLALGGDVDDVAVVLSAEFFLAAVVVDAVAEEFFLLVETVAAGAGLALSGDDRGAAELGRRKVIKIMLSLK